MVDECNLNYHIKINGVNISFKTGYAGSDLVVSNRVNMDTVLSHCSLIISQPT